MKNEAETLGINIKCALVRAGYTCTSFSEKSRIAKTTLSKLINGKTDARLSTLSAVARFLDIDIKDLFEGL